MKKSFIQFCVFAFFLLVKFNASAQQIKGIIYDDYDSAPLQAAIVLNMRTKNSAITNTDGKYNIHFKYGDTIMVSLIGYKEIQFVVRAAGNDDVNRNIYLKPDYGMLGEVVVSQLTPYQRDSLKRKQLYESTLSREQEWVSGVQALASPATAIAQLVNKNAKQRRKFQKNFVEWEAQRFIESRYTYEYVGSIVPLKDDSLVNFVNAYPIPADFARAATNTELDMWVRYNYADWKSLKVKPVGISDTFNMK